MKNHHGLPRSLRLLVLPALALSFTSSGWAQNAAAMAPTPAQLAKYDKNKNGKLDADELAAMAADEQKANAAVRSDGAGKSEDVVELSPFQVTAGDERGYAAHDTLSNRMKTPIADLASSISVVTKQQLEDFAALDINDIFLYELGTEGTGQYTETATDGRNEGVWDNVAGNPTGSNRIRGLASANIAVGGFAASGTIPIDTYNVEQVEISRGPNSMIAGLGDAGGTVNLVTSRGNVSRESTSIQTRVDSYGGFRASLDINRPIIKNKLALRLSTVYSETGYIRKPSIDRTDRQQIAVTYRPFRTTTLTASFERFSEFAVRANSMTPRDSVSLWVSRGSPTWDPITRIGKINGVAQPVGTIPAGLVGGFGASRILEYIDNDRVELLTKGANPNNTILGLTTGQQLVSISNESTNGQSLFKIAGTTNKAVYDWESVNMAASAYQDQSAKIINANLDQSLINTPRHRLDFNAAWRREDQRDYRRQFIGQLDGVGTTLQIDPNERLIDGRPNPYFLRTFIGGVNPQVFRKPVFNDNYRTQLAYQLDLRREHNALKWLGMHRINTYGEYRVSLSAPQNLRYHDSIVDNRNFLPATITPTTNLSNNNGSLMYTLYFMGNRGDLGLKYANEGAAAYNGKFLMPYVGATSTSYNFSEPVDVEEIYFALDTQKKKVRTQGGSIQSYLLDDNLIMTFGKRKDRVATSANLPLNLVNNFFDETNLWNFGRNKRWRFGDTTTKDFVLRPLRSFEFVKRESESGSGVSRFLAQAARSLNLYYNQSDSFSPADTAYNLFLQELPNPSGLSKEWGFGLVDMFDRKFSIKVKHFETTSNDSRAATGVIATRALGIDFHPGGQNLGFNLYDAAQVWESSLHPTWTVQQVMDAAAKRIGYTSDYIAAANNMVIADVSDAISKGWELELQFNPTRYWTVRANGNQQEAIDKNISSSIQEFIATRLPVWTTITVPTDRLPDGSQLANAGALWWNLNQSGGLPSNYYNTNVRNALLPLIAGQGKAKPQTARNSFSLVTNYQLGGLGWSDSHRWMKNTSIGGSYRWSSARAIGYLGAPPDPDGIIRTLDKDKPVYGKPDTNFDLTMSYRTRLFRNKIGTRFQLNVRNVTENGRLLGVSVNPDGKFYQYRIIDPRQFIFTTTFDL